MKFSISNLAWGNTPLSEIIPKLSNAGVQGIEIAPTAIWPNLDDLRDEEINELKSYLLSHGLVVSGIQSLLYGHPELQLFDQQSWRDMKSHLENVFRIGGLLGADVAVFGSPRNRIKGRLDNENANQMAKNFFKQLIPSLVENDMILTLEPNAPDYGADYLTTYEDVIKLSQEINSERIGIQIDTGCLIMVGTSPAIAYEAFKPRHIHLSTPHLGQVPGDFHFGRLLQLARSTDYEGWIVIEMLQSEGDSIGRVLDSIGWLSRLESAHR